MKLDTLYKRDKSGKKVLSYEIEVKEDSLLSAIITRTTGFIDGKKQLHRDDIQHGKQNRTVYEQAVFQANSMWNSAKDEGYKSAKDLNIVPSYEKDLTPSELAFVLLAELPQDRTDASGTLKPMKCTALQDTKTGGILATVVKKIKFPAYAQPKLDGVRCFAEKKGGQFYFTSSSGKSYDVVCRFIKKELENLDLPDGTILDGELYIHGVPLQKISGWCRKETPIEEHNDIQYWIFDTASKQSFSERLRTIAALPFEAYLRIKFTPTTIVHAEDDIHEWHDKYVADGYEGLIIRNADGNYAFGIRSSEIFKYKDFQDAEFEIVRITVGKRGAFDMVFNLITSDGKHFAAKPIGDEATKLEYCKNEKDLIGKMATVRFLTYSELGVPQGNPVLKAIRDYE